MEILNKKRLSFSKVINNDLWPYIIYDNNHQLVAKADSFEYAIVMTAAPEMLETLKEIVELVNLNDKKNNKLIIEKATNAINSAT